MAGAVTLRDWQIRVVGKAASRPSAPTSAVAMGTTPTA